MSISPVDVIVPAAGVGKRMSLGYPKQYAKIGSKTVIEHTISALLSSPYVARVIVGINKDDPYYDSLPIASNPRVIKGLGGTERCDTVLNCMDLASTDYVMVHDAARPLLSACDLKKLYENATLTSCDGAILACKVADTIKYVTDGIIEKTVDRAPLYRAYTPQMFKTKLLKQALQESFNKGFKVTDDSSAMEMCGYRVLIVEGSAQNFKLTTPDDLALAKLIIGNDDV